MGTGVRHNACVEVRPQLKRVRSHHHVGTRDQTQLAILGGKLLLPTVSPLASPSIKRHNVSLCVPHSSPAITKLLNPLQCYKASGTRCLGWFKAELAT